MSEQKRLLLLLGTVAVLIAANFFVYLGEDQFDSSLFGDELKTGYAPQVAGLIHDLENLPRLDFQAGRSMGDLEIAAQRNPFIFGADRARELEREQRMEELRQSREVVAQVIQAEPQVEKARFDGQIIGLMGNSQNQDNYMVSVSFEQEIHILKVGDPLKNRYRLTGANQELVTFLHLASGEEVRIRLETK